MIDKLHFFERKTNARLKERVYTNGSSQIQAINNIIKNFEGGKHITILKGGAGSGKSLIGLETIRYFGSGYVVVPRIYHQDQYREDYSDENSRVYMSDEYGDVIDIKTMKGKNNFKCRLLEGEEWAEYRKQHPDKLNCDNSTLPCNGSGTTEQKLISCPHFLGNIPMGFGNENDDDMMVNPNEKYVSVCGIRKLMYNDSVSMCRYHKNFIEAIDNNINIINSKKLEVECNIGRLPKKKVLVIDEFDLFLEELASPKIINFDKVMKSLDSVSSDEDFSDEEFDAIKRLKFLVNEEIKRVTLTDNYGTKIQPKYKDQVFRMGNNHFSESCDNISEMLDIFQDNEFLQDVKGLDSMYKTFVYNTVEFGSLNFYYSLDKALNLNIFSLDSEFIVNSIFNKFDHVLLMSATKQSDRILEEFFGINDYGFVETEETIVGTMRIANFGDEITFAQGRYSKDVYYQKMKEERENQLKATGKLIGKTEKMFVGDKEIKLKRLFHIMAYNKLPKASENNLDFNLSELSIEYLDEKEMFDDFKNGDRNFYKSTKMLRAIDLPDDKCRVVMFQKLPFPVISPYYRAIEKKYGSDFMWDILWDKCNRELIQGSTRGIRNANDWCFITSPDIRVKEQLNRIFGNNPRFKIHNFTDNIRA